MPLRRHDRHTILRQATWDYYSERTGKKSGYITDISRGGCQLRTTLAIPHQRWLRILTKVGDGADNMLYNLVGRVVRTEEVMEAQAVAGGETAITLYRYGLQFMHPTQLSVQDFDLILAFSSKNLSVRSCLSLNSKSS